MGGFGGWAITKDCFDYIRKILPEGKIILEFGSGWGTGELAKHYKMYSIEHNEGYIGGRDSTYIHAPIKDGWYDYDIVKNNLPETYDLIFVDGPTGRIGRDGFYKHLDLFDTSVPIIIDDVHRDAEKALIEKVSKKLNKEYKILPDKATGVIL